MDKQQLINFAVNNDRLELLKARTNKFNPFKVLKVQDHEIRHSNILAWIFNPAENHNFDDRILKRFLLKILLKPVNDEILDNMDLVYNLQKTPLMDLKVFREKEHIDLLLVSEQQRIVILVENKIYSGEHSNQLNRYYEYVTNNYPGYYTIPIFLTLDGLEATQNHYFTASYDDILETIEFMMENYRERTSSDVISFLEFYSAILKEKYVMDVELKRLCKEIYQQNKDVVDMIYTVGNEIDIEPAVNLFNKKYPDVIPVNVKGRTYWFGIESFVKGRINAHDSWGGGFALCFWFTEYYGKLKLTLEVGPFDDSQKRIEFLQKLEALGIKISDRAKEPERKYTRLYTATHSVKDWTDSEELEELMGQMYEKDDLVAMRRVVKKAVDEFGW